MKFSTIKKTKFGFHIKSLSNKSNYNPVKLTWMAVIYAYTNSAVSNMNAT